MSPQEAEPTQRGARRRAVRWAAIVAMAILIVIAALGVLLAIKWPFSQGWITRSLETSLHGQVHMTSFHSSVFPHPGCIVGGFTLTRSGHDGETGPVATATKLIINSAYLDLFLRPKYIHRIVVDNLRVQLHRASTSAGNQSAQGDSPSGAQQSTSSQQSRSNSDGSSKGGTTHVGQIIASNATLTAFRSDGEKPLTFDIHSLVLDSVGPEEAMAYRLEMTNALPPGEISSHGRLGPWNSQDTRKTPLFGTSYFERANLDVFSGIAGSLSSRDDFEGTLGNIDVNGTADVPDFKVKRARASVHLRAHFRARVNALTGDVELQRVEASLLQTHIEARGRIGRPPGGGAKVTALDFSVHDGRIQDVIALFARDKPPVNGVTNFRAHTITRSFGKEFLKETQLRDEFEIADARFTNPQRQASVDQLSVRAARHKPNGRAPEVTAEFHGQVLLKDGVAHFRGLSMGIPAATAQMDGAYNLLNDKIDFHGTLRTQTEISKTTRGIKSVLLKPLDPFFKKNSAGAVVPAQMTGTYDHPQFAVVLASSKKPAKSK